MWKVGGLPGKPSLGKSHLRDLGGEWGLACHRQDGIPGRGRGLCGGGVAGGLGPGWS